MKHLLSTTGPSSPSFSLASLAPSRRLNLTVYWTTWGVVCGGGEEHLLVIEGAGDGVLAHDTHHVPPRLQAAGRVSSEGGQLQHLKELHQHYLASSTSTI